jgi:hypothetical protein
MMPTEQEIEKDLKKLREMIILAAIIAFGAGFIAGGLITGGIAV